MEKIQVIHFLEDLGKGGLENVVFNITTMLNPEIFDVRVVCRIRGGYTAERIAEKGIPLQILQKKKISPLSLSKTLRAIRSHKSAILHCHGLFAGSSEAIIGPIVGYDAVFVHVHNLEKAKTMRQKLKLSILKRSVSSFIAVSKGVFECLKQNSINNVKVVSNGIDTKKFCFSMGKRRRKINFTNDTFVIGMVGRIVKRKGFDNFVELIDRIPNTSGLIVGEGPYEEYLRSMIKHKKLENRISFIPFQSQEALPEIYSSLDALFLYSEREGLPLSLLEAQAVGVPYIGNNVGGIGEVVKDGYNGFLLNSFDIDNVKDRIIKLKENPIYYRKNARKVIEEKFSLDKMVKKIEKIYVESLK